MHVIQRPVRQRVQKRMYLASERHVVNGVGLGEVDGLFNIGKMFSRLTKITPSSFQLKNIMGALGSATMFTASAGLSSLAPKATGAHSSLSKAVGYGTAAVAVVAGGAALLPAGALTGIGSGLMTGLKTVATVLPVAQQVMGGGGQQQQSIDPYAQQYADAQAQAQAQAQAAYDAQVRAEQAAMYNPAGYSSNMPIVNTYGGSPIPADMNTSYGDLRSPYTGITEDGQQVQVDPMTGQIIQPGMSTEMMIGLSAVALALGIYFMSDSSTSNN